MVLLLMILLRGLFGYGIDFWFVLSVRVWYIVCFDF